MYKKGILFVRERCVVEAWKNLVFSFPSMATLIYPLCFQKAIFSAIANCKVCETTRCSIFSALDRVRASSFRSIRLMISFAAVSQKCAGDRLEAQFFRSYLVRFRAFARAAADVSRWVERWFGAQHFCIICWQAVDRVQADSNLKWRGFGTLV